MKTYLDLLSGDKVLSDSYEYKEVFGGFFIEAEGKWVAVDADIGGNPSAEDGEETLDSSAKVLDLQEAFQLHELPPFSKKELTAYLKRWCHKLLPLLPRDKQAEFEAKSTRAFKYLLDMVEKFQFFTTRSMDPGNTLIYAHYKEDSFNPTFLYPLYALKEEMS